MNFFAHFFHTHKSSQALVVASFFAMAFVVLFFCIHESYLYSHIFTYDSAWYFICAKAWISGLKPYVDFADSKGPLLWIIYAVAYKLSAFSFVGVLWVASAFYTGTMWFVYKAFTLFISQHKWAFIGTSLWFAFLFIFPLAHPLLHTEDFSLLFLSATFYYTLALYYSPKTNINNAAFITGVCLGALLMIKFFTASLLSGFILAQLFYAHKQNLSVFKLIFLYAVGTLLICIPFILHFYFTNNLFNFLNEYIFKTFVSYKKGDAIETSGTLYLVYLHTQWLFMALIGMVWFIKSKHQWGYLPLVCFAPFALSPFVVSFPQYSLPANLFVFFLLLWLIFYLQKKQLSLSKAYALVGLNICFAISFHLYRNTIKNANISDFFCSKNSTNTAFAYYNYLVAQKKQARILYAKGLITDVGYQSGALPACKYFALQYGVTQEMINNQLNTIKTKKADFITSLKEENTFNAFLQNNGYIEYYFPNPNGFTLFSKYKLKEPAKDNFFSPIDILLKRTPQIK